MRMNSRSSSFLMAINAQLSIDTACYPHDPDADLMPISKWKSRNSARPMCYRNSRECIGGYRPFEAEGTESLINSVCGCPEWSPTRSRTKNSQFPSCRLLVSCFTAWSAYGRIPNPANNRQWKVNLPEKPELSFTQEPAASGAPSRIADACGRRISAITSWPVLRSK
jgi:hypothetical protein